MRWIPAAGSKRWWSIALLSTLLTSGALWLIRFGINGQTLTSVHMLRFALLGAVISLVFSLAGWLGARWIWLFSNAGLIAGLIAMSAYTAEQTGWEDLAGFLTFMLFTICGFAAGSVAQIVAFFVRKARSK